MVRIKFSKGKQRKFFDRVLELLNCPSLRELIARGIDADYSSLKNYYSERRTIPENLFNSLCEISKLDKTSFSSKKISEHWGQIKGGKISKRKKIKHGPAKN